MISLSGKTIGSPDNAYAWYLQCGGIALSTGFHVGLGDGTETKLWLDSDGVGFSNAAGFTTSFRCEDAAADQDLTFHYTAGAGKVYPQIVAVLAADATSSSTTPATVASFSATLAASTVYDFEMILLVSTATTTVSPRLTINGPTAQTAVGWFEIEGPVSVSTIIASVPTRSYQQFAAWGTQWANATDLPATGTPLAVRVRGVCKTTGTTPASAVEIGLASETGGTQVTLHAASMMIFTPRG